MGWRERQSVPQGFKRASFVWSFVQGVLGERVHGFVPQHSDFGALEFLGQVNEVALVALEVVLEVWWAAFVAQGEVKPTLRRVSAITGRWCLRLRSPPALVGHPQLGFVFFSFWVAGAPSP